MLAESLMVVSENVVLAKRLSPLSPPVSSLQLSVGPVSPPLFTSGFSWAAGCAAVGQVGQDGEETELKKWQSREAHGVKEETFIITIVSSSLAPASMTAQMSCLFNTPEPASSPPPLIPQCFSLKSYSANPPSLPHNPSAPHLLLSCFCHRSEWAHTAFGGGWVKAEKKRGRKAERVRGRVAAFWL